MDIEKIISLIKMEEIVISFIYLTLYLIISIIWQIKANLRQLNPCKDTAR